MKKYMPLNGLRWSRDSGSTLYDTPQTVVLGQPGGESFALQSFVRIFDVCQSKARSGYGVFPVSKAMVWQQKSYDMTSNESFYLRLKMNIR